MSETEEISLDVVALIETPTTPLAVRKAIENLEARMLEMPQTEVPVTHTFSGDTYVRSIVLREGLIATGKVHRHPTIHLVLEGSMTVVTELGGRREVSAGDIFVAPAGNKMCGIAHEDTIWATAHTTKLRDIEAIEQELCFSDAELPGYYAKLGA